MAVYLVKRYAVRRIIPAFYKGGLPPYRIKRALDYIADNLGTDVSLSDVASIAGMSPHYFSELFKQTVGRSPHNYVLLQRIERAKQLLRDPKRSIIEAGLDVGFQNPSHFARMFRKLEGHYPVKVSSGLGVEGGLLESLRPTALAMSCSALLQQQLVRRKTTKLFC